MNRHGVVVMVAALAACSPALQGRAGTYAPASPAEADDDYFSRSSAAKFHALRRQFVPQHNEASCSVAAARMVINTALAQRGRNPVTVEQMLATDPTGKWAASTATDEAPGVTLDRLGLYLMRAYYGVGIKSVAVDVMHVEKQDAETVGMLTHTLELLEQKADDYFVVANFSHARLLRAMTPVGHFAVVGAYDAKRERVLVFDVDPTAPRPYWVSVSRFVEAMNTPDDETGISRGYLVVRFP